MKTVEYKFVPVERCNMCGDDTAAHRILGRRLNASQGISPRKVVGIAATVMRCTNCGLIYSNPQPIPHSLQDHYGVSPESYWKQEYFTVPPTYFAGEIKNLLRLMPSPVNGHRPEVLDIGAGIGKIIKALEAAGMTAYGIEPGAEFYRMAVEKNLISPERLQNLPIEEANFPAAKFDAVTFGAVLEHLYNPGDALKKVMHWVKPDGIVHVEVPNADYLISKLYNTFFRLRGTDFVTNISPMHTPYHLYEFTLKSFHLNGKASGYEVAHAEYYIGESATPQIDRLLAPLMNATRTGMGLIVYLRKK